MGKRHKRPVAEFQPSLVKRPILGAAPRVTKVPAIAADPSTNHLYPSWRIGRLLLVGPFGWHELEAAKLLEIRAKLANFESMTWNDIIVGAKKRNHTISVDQLCKDAQHQLASLNLYDIDEVVSLHLTGTERVWGYREGAVLHVLWWDPDHQIRPSLPKHT
ncbi:MAG TPA: hypothetical protein VG323_12905 [Thermoanaerobaculia bacterium]|nr:hypothetical protein [Thermoanaerobaculia bacterium]